MGGTGRVWEFGTTCQSGTPDSPSPPSFIILSTPTRVLLYFCGSTLYVVGYSISVKRETKHKDVAASSTKNIVFVEPLQAVVQVQGNTCTRFEVILVACIDILS